MLLLIYKGVCSLQRLDFNKHRNLTKNSEPSKNLSNKFSKNFWDQKEFSGIIYCSVKTWFLKKVIETLNLFKNSASLRNSAVKYNWACWSNVLATYYETVLNYSCRYMHYINLYCENIKKIVCVNPEKKW